MTGAALCSCTWSQVIYITVWSRGGKIQEAGRKAIKRCLVTEHPWGKRRSEELSGIWKTSTSMYLLPCLKELRIRTEWVGFPWWLRWQKNLPAMQETRVWSLGREVPLEKEIATYSRILALRISWTKEPGRLWSMGSQRVRHDWANFTHSFSQNV